MDKPKDINIKDPSMSISSDLSEIIFHDFKNKLSIISGLAQLSMLKTELDEIRIALSNINKTTFDLENMLNKFCGYTKDQDEDLQKSHLLYKIIYSSLEMIAYRVNVLNAIGKKINLSLMVNSNVKVWCNEYELKQGFLNILMNAMDSMENLGGVLHIEISNANDNVHLIIEDSGIGISKEGLDKLFKYNFTTKEKGTGLGLKIAKNSIEKIGGTINITSEVGVGTKVLITLPIYQDEMV